MDSLKRWFFNYWHIAFGACAVMTGIAAIGRLGSPGDSPATEIPVVQVPQETAPEGTPQAHAWDAVQHRLAVAEDEAKAEVAAQLAASVDPVFADAREGAKRFAKAVLSAEANLKIAGGVLDKGVKVFNDAYGQITGLPVPYDWQYPPDQFEVYVAERFRRHVLDSERLNQAMRSAIAGYAARLREQENALLVDLRADLADGAWQGDEALPPLPDEEMLAGPIDVAVSEAVSDASGDFVASIVKGLFSWVIGDMVAAPFAHDDDPAWKRLGSGAIIGKMVDGALDGAIGATGYDPESKIALRVTAAVDGLRKLLVEGDPQVRDDHIRLLLCAYGHPDPAVRSTCLEVALILERKAQLGLRETMHVLHARRALARRDALFRHFHGQEATPPLHWAKFLENCPPADQIIAVANEIRSQYGKE